MYQFFDLYVTQRHKPLPRPRSRRRFSDTQFILSRKEEQRLKNSANGPDEDDYESSGEGESDGDNREDDDDQPTRFETGSSRHDLCYNKLKKKNPGLS